MNRIEFDKKQKLIDIYDELIKIKLMKIKVSNDYREIKQYETEIDDIIEKMKDV